MEKLKRTCRLCLRVSENFRIIEADTIDMLNMLKLKINLPASGKYVMCSNCAETLVDSFNFLATCNDTHCYMLAFHESKKGAKVNLKNVYMSKKENDFSIPKNHVVCGFCMDLVKYCTTISLDYGIENAMLEKCLPELDLSIIEKPIICAPCHESLDKCFHFVKGCSSVEEQIQKYCEAVRIDSHDLVDLTNVREYTSRNTVKSEECNTLDMIEKVKTLCEDDQYANGEVEHNDGSWLEVKEQKLNSLQEVTSDNTSVCKEECDKPDMVDTVDTDEEIKREIEEPNFMEVQDQNLNSVQQFPSELDDTKFLIKEDIEIKTEEDDFDSFQESFVEYKIADDPLEIAETGTRKYTKPNMLTHKSPSEINTFKCDLCTYKTKRKVDLKRHRLTHKNSSEVTTFKCELCTYETKRKVDLERHRLTHKNFSEVTTFKCESCSYETRHYYLLKRHLKTHKSPSEKNMFKCTLCSFQTKRKDNLKQHLLTHKSPSEINMFKCEWCTYETRRKRDVKRHLLSHKSSSEVTMFKCGFCSYEAKRKNYLSRHLLTHKSPAEINMFKCEICSFSTKHKYYFKTHLITHKSPAETNMLNCEMCSYETRCRSALNNHSLIHKSVAEIEMFKCKLCSFNTRYKSSLKNHSLTHKSPGELEMFKCNLCSFDTKYKSSLKTHLASHVDRPQC